MAERTYTMDLAQISLAEFQAMLASAELLPGRRILLDGLEAFMARVQQNGIHHLAALQKALKDKKRYPELAAVWGVRVEYLTVLNREINSYVSRPLPLNELGVFDAAELARLESAGLKTTKDLYECGAPDQLHLPAESLSEALELCDLLRITGVGPAYARALRGIGIRSAADYRGMPSEEILARYQQTRARHGLPNLGLKDVEYCKRFCRKLSDRIA
jgi:hypothetical protein